MKLLRKLLLILFALIVISAVGGYFFFKEKFKAPPNQLALSNENVEIPFTWLGDSLNNEWNPYTALLLPVQLPGCGKTFYMQFDLGSPYSMFYKHKLLSINEKYGNISIKHEDGKHMLRDYSFTTGALQVKARQINLRTFTTDTSGVDWTDSAGITIIGTLGADLIDKKVLVINYPRQTLFIGDHIPGSLADSISLHEFSFKERRVLLPALINGKKTELFFDTGSSAFELLTDQSTCEQLKKKDAVWDHYEVNSWDKKLTAHSIVTNGSIQLGGTSVPITKATYIEGTGWLQNLLMKFSGMGGMTGNKLFINRIVVLDTGKQKFAVL